MHNGVYALNCLFLLYIYNIDIHMYVCMYMHAFKHACMLHIIYVLHTHVCIYIYIYIYMYIYIHTTS